MTHRFEYCPACGGQMNHPFVALSRRDNKTSICSECGHREAWEDLEKYVIDNSEKV